MSVYMVLREKIFNSCGLLVFLSMLKVFYVLVILCLGSSIWAQDVVRESNLEQLAPQRALFASRKVVPFGTNNKYLVKQPSDRRLPRVTTDLVHDPLVPVPRIGSPVYLSMFDEVIPKPEVPLWKRILRTITKPITLIFKRG